MNKKSKNLKPEFYDLIAQNAAKKNYKKKNNNNKIKCKQEQAEPRVKHPKNIQALIKRTP